MIPLFQVAMDTARALANLTEVLTPRPDGSVYVGEGPKCAELEVALGDVLAMRVLLVNSGTSALRLALHLAGARPGTEVISTPVTCIATNTAILESGARIVWADVDPATGNISVEDVTRKVTSKTVAVVGVDWAGRLCDFDALRAKLRGISILEDAAHAFGVDRLNGARGDFVCLSAQAIKFWTMGDGGALSCPGTALHERARLLRWFGLDRTRGDSMRCYQSVVEAGFKMQSNDIAACVGLANLPGAIDRVNLNRANAAWYDEHLSGHGYVQPNPFDGRCSYWFYGIRVSRPIAFEGFMASRGIATGQVHSRNDVNPCFDSARRTDLPGVDDFAAHQTNIPCGWWLTDRDRDTIAVALEEWSRQPEARW